MSLEVSSLDDNKSLGLRQSEVQSSVPNCHNIERIIAALSPKSVFTNLSSKFDENLPVRSQFYSDHRVFFLCLHLANPLPLDCSLFAFVLCFYDKNHPKKTNAVKAYRPA